MADINEEVGNLAMFVVVLRGQHVVVVAEDVVGDQAADVECTRPHARRLQVDQLQRSAETHVVTYTVLQKRYLVTQDNIQNFDKNIFFKYYIGQEK